MPREIKSKSEIPTFQELVQSSLKKFESVIPAVEELKAKYLTLRIESIDDKTGYEKVQKALRFMVTKRNEVEEKRKELKADSIAFGKAIDKHAKDIFFLIAPIEEHLREEKEKIDYQIEQIKNEKERKKQEELAKRHRKLIQAGMKLVGNEYFWQSAVDLENIQTLAVVNLETLDDDELDDFCQKIVQTKLIDEEKVALEQKRFDEEKARLEAEQLKFKQEQEALQLEMQKMKDQRTQMRKEYLISLNLTEEGEWYVFKDNAQVSHRVMPVSEVFTLDNVSVWELRCFQLKGHLNKINSEAEERILEIERIKKQAEIDAQKRILEQKAKEEQLEKERVANLSDKQKVTEYAKKLLEIEVPEVKTAKWKKQLKSIQDSLYAAVEDISI